MITPQKIEEWIREVEERSSSAPNIIRYISNRLRDLSSRNEELQAENLALLTGKKIDEYESRIANLEYQVELLKRQLGGEVVLPSGALDQAPKMDTFSLVLYDSQGWTLRVDQDFSGLVSPAEIARFEGEVLPEGRQPRLLAAGPQEELLFVFDTGRVVTMPVSELKPTGLDWKQAYLQEPRGVEELAAILPVAKMSLFDSCLQTSRKGFVKKIKESQLEAYLTNSFIGSGVKLPLDKTCSLTLCQAEDGLILVSKEGFLLGLETSRLPITIEEAMKLGTTDHVVSAFAFSRPAASLPASSKPSTGRLQPTLLVVTQSGKVLQRDASWLEISDSLTTRGQAIFSKERREAGVRVAGAAAALEQDWGVALRSDGVLIAHRVKEMLASGTILSGLPDVEILDFTTLRLPPGQGEKTVGADGVRPSHKKDSTK